MCGTLHVRLITRKVANRERQPQYTRVAHQSCSFQRGVVSSMRISYTWQVELVKYIIDKWTREIKENCVCVRARVRVPGGRAGRRW